MNEDAFLQVSSDFTGHTSFCDSGSDSHCKNRLSSLSFEQGKRVAPCSPAQEFVPLELVGLLYQHPMFAGVNRNCPGHRQRLLLPSHRGGAGHALKRISSSKASRFGRGPIRASSLGPVSCLEREGACKLGSAGSSEPAMLA